MKKSKTRIQYTENGRMNPTLSTLEKVAKALGVNIDTLLK